MNDDLKNVANENVFKKSVEVFGDDRVVRKHLTQTKTAGNVECEWTFDFTGVKYDDLLELASRSVLIAYRPHFKVMDAKEVRENAVQDINVKAFLESSNTRVKKSDTAKAIDMIDKLSQEERDKIIELLERNDRELAGDSNEMG